MHKLTSNDLLSHENYRAIRHQFCQDVMLHKKHRQIQIGQLVRLIFEDSKTIQYQVQEMLRSEKIVDQSGIQHELDAYNPLIPDGRNWKATFMLEYADVKERREKMRDLVGIENQVWVQVNEFVRVYAIVDDDCVRDDSEKTSSVHFLRFELTPPMIAALKKGATFKVGIDHPRYGVTVEHVPSDVYESLVDDLDDVSMS